jgi:U3 small nucleolar RNA-associated protein 11
MRRAARKKFGLLEKHKDYVVRARNFHKKDATLKVCVCLCLMTRCRGPGALRGRHIHCGMSHQHTRTRDRAQALKRKAEERNPDEFYFAMEKARTKGGVHQGSLSVQNKYSADELKLMKTQDVRYLTRQTRVEAEVGG